jgi:hypothetical protein
MKMEEITEELASENEFRRFDAINTGKNAVIS